MVEEGRIQGGNNEEGDINPPLSRAEVLMQAHPDITVIRAFDGDVYIVQTVPEKWRHIWVDVEREEGSQRHHPSVFIYALESPEFTYRMDDTVYEIRKHGLTTIVKVHTEDDGQVTPEVGYAERRPYPSTFGVRHIRDLEKYSLPIPAQELVATVRTGLEMLKAYSEASRDQRERIDNLHSGNDGWTPQIVDETRPDADAYIASASGLLGEMMRQGGISFDTARLKSIYALNALNKVTDAMLPSEMPPVSPNRREPRRRTTSNISAPQRRRRTPRG